MSTQQKSKRGNPSKRRRILPKTRPRGQSEAKAIALRERDRREATRKSQMDWIIQNFTTRQIEAIQNEHGFSEWWRRSVFSPDQIRFLSGPNTRFF